MEKFCRHALSAAILALIFIASFGCCRAGETGLDVEPQPAGSWAGQTADIEESGSSSFRRATAGRGWIYSQSKRLFSNFMLGTGHFFKQTINWTVEESADPSAFWKGYISNWSGDRAEIEIFAYNFYYRSGSDYAFGFDNFRIKGIDEQPSFFNGFSHITGPLSISTHAVSPSFPGIHIAPSLNVYNVKRFFSAGNGLALRGMLNFIFSPLWLFSAFFFLQAFLLWRLARRLGCKEAYFSWLPFLNDYLIVRISGKPWCLLIIMYIPILGIFASVLLWREIFHKLGLSGFFSILMLVPIVNMLVLASLIYFLDPADGRERLSHG